MLYRNRRCIPYAKPVSSARPSGFDAFLRIVDRGVRFTEGGNGHEGAPNDGTLETTTQSSVVSP
jgi:hypothetical protein